LSVAASHWIETLVPLIAEVVGVPGADGGVVSGGGSTVTKADALLVPPGPPQVIVKPVLAVSGPTTCEPVIAVDAVHGAVQPVEFALVQLSVTEPLKATGFGLTERLTDGNGGPATKTVTEALAGAPGPKQVIVNVV
jgi:hypothetical protein